MSVSSNSLEQFQKPTHLSVLSARLCEVDVVVRIFRVPLILCVKPGNSYIIKTNQISNVFCLLCSTNRYYSSKENNYLLGQHAAVKNLHYGVDKKGLIFQVFINLPVVKNNEK